MNKSDMMGLNHQRERRQLQTGRFWLCAVLLILVGWLLTACSGRDAEATPLAPTPTVTVAVQIPTVEPTATSDVQAAPSPVVLSQPVQDSTISVMATPTAQIPVYGYQVIEQYPHDPMAFTQGLVYVDGELYEGTGRYGQSTLRRVDLETGDSEQVVRLADEYFGEGITVLDDRIFQLTWRSQLGFVYDRTTFEPLNVFTYPTEGWGVTHDGKSLIMSDGSNVLYYLEPEEFTLQRQVPVFAGSEPVTMLNELEYIDGYIYANVWQTERIAKIDPASGDVVAWIDLSGLFPPEDRSESAAVLNGIAYDAERERLLVTGKLWPALFWIELIPPTNQE
jgi:glutamine cyclotransferase